MCGLVDPLFDRDFCLSLCQIHTPHSSASDDSTRIDWISAMPSSARLLLSIVVSVSLLSLSLGSDSCGGAGIGCTDCVSLVGCGFCASGECMAGNATGPASPTGCESQAWLYETTMCSAVPCATPAPPPHATFGTCETTSGWFASGDTCIFDCQQPFLQIGDEFMQCNNGVWNGSQVCSPFDPASFLSEQNFHMNDVDWFLLIFAIVWSACVLVLSILLLSGCILPHLGASPPNLTLWDLDQSDSKLQRQQRCRRWFVCLIGNGVIALAIAALATDVYSKATFPSDQVTIDIAFGAFDYSLQAGPPLNIDMTQNYASCDSSDVSDVTLCYLLRGSMIGSFSFGVVGCLSSCISILLLFLVLIRFRRETYWKHAMKFNLVATSSFLTTTLIYASVSHVLLKQLYSQQFDFEFGRSWFLFLGTLLLGGMWSCMTYLYYRPTALDAINEEEAAKAGGERAEVFLHSESHTRTSARITNNARNERHNEYGAMKDQEYDPYA